ncbi:hypothetical protein NKJ72_17175 [Mesorhizobium sp. M0045]|uniref:hypothetical protein n=1 Tax=Mesorhizobium sp. M0045 TaxID=2956857 RepID=UPI0033384C53
MQELLTAEFAPIVIFAYNRVDRLRALIESLSRCRQFHASPVQIYVDGPKDIEDSVKVNGVLRYLSSISHGNIKIVQRDSNYGLRRSIYAGVGQMLSEYDKVIVLEDDLIASEDILSYFNAALEKYASHSRVYSVCAYAPVVDRVSSFASSLILPSAHPWGWATWRRAWREFDIDLHVRPEDISSRSFRTAFNLSGFRNYTTMLRLAAQGRLDSWFLVWNYYLFMKGGVSIFPPRSLVTNAGFSKGTHSSSWNILRHFNKRMPPARFDFDLPSDIRVDYWAIDCLARSREARLSLITTKAGILKRMVRDWKL